MNKLIFNGKEYKFAGRNGHALKDIVYDVVKQYIEDNINTNYSDLKNTFNHLHSYEVVLNKEDYATWLSKGYENGTPRYFPIPIKHNGEEYYITNQWGFQDGHGGY
jgi:hypothetical protein